MTIIFKHLCNFNIISDIISDSIRFARVSKESINSLGKLMEEYTYGWYIEDETYSQQIKSLLEFQLYIWEKVIENGNGE